MTTRAQRDRHERWLLELTSTPTAAGREQRVIAWIERWVKRREGLRLRRDRAGNLIITRKRERSARPLYITAHLDHPAFVVRRVGNRRTIELEFRGGVHDPYFEDATIEIFDREGRAHRATIVHLDSGAKPFKLVTAEPAKETEAIRPGDVGRWRFTGRVPRIEKGIVHTHACDDLAAAAAALATLDTLLKRKGCDHVGLLFTRAEEVGFIGAIAACKEVTVPRSARLICLENSRSFAESPVGGGPILRVGDKMSVFDPRLTNRLGAILTAYAERHPQFKWQRRLMPGGTCEATTFSTYGFESTCVCLPLGNYHNMKNIDGVLGGKRPARVGPEFISVDDYHGLVELLVAVAPRLDDDAVESLEQRMEKLHAERGFVLGEQWD